MVSESSSEKCIVETKRRGNPRSQTFAFTVADAERAGLAPKENWRKYPAAMLMARAQMMAARAVYPDIASGLYDRDELE